ncbi:VOC family protein [Priestia flexa]|uniref:VOC family protein n=1 Tax=Priestia flexa TaxID=86664 RepID=UPI00287059C7|nr:VOC family protein [Priestia flexa]
MDCLTLQLKGELEIKKQITPYLSFNGNAKEALEFYKEVFEGQVQEIQTFGEVDFPTPPEAQNRIMHAKFKKDELFSWFLILSLSKI